MAIPQLTKYAASTLPSLNMVLSEFSALTHEASRSQSRFESRSGLTQVSEASQYTRNRWKISGFLLSNSDKTAFEDFWEGRRCSCLPFKWTDDVSGDLHFVRFAESKVLFQRLSVSAWAIEFDIVEAHPLEIDTEA